jgi:hypothetical protein
MNLFSGISGSVPDNARSEIMGKKVVIDVLTLDSVQCAACGYVLESVSSLPQEIKDLIEYREWSIKTQEGINKFLELQGRVLPTICINGELCFESLVPIGDELIQEIKKRAE